MTIQTSILPAIATLLLCLGSAPAQQNSVSITPASIDAKVKRGSSYSQNFTLTNDTGTRLRLKCSLDDIWYDEHNNRTTARAGTLPRSASLWVQFFPAEVIVEPRGSVVVQAVITVPQTAAGGYYTVPVFEALPIDQPTPSTLQPISQSSTASASIGIRFRGLIMIVTTGAAEYGVDILSGEVSPPTASSELAMRIDLRNGGTAHVRMRGAFAIINSSGGLAGRGVFEEKRFFPGQRNTLQGGWAGVLSPGKYTSVITLSYDRVGMQPASLAYEIAFVVP